MTTKVAERSYLDLLRYVYRNGQHRPGTRTGIATRGIFDAFVIADLREGFPLLTTKRMPFLSIVAELLGFLRGYQSAADFRQLGTRIWDANANESPGWLANPKRRGTDDLGRIYGVQWREWQGSGCTLPIDQIANLIHGLVTDPYGRRHIVSAWNVGDLNAMALPPCHVMFQCYVDTPKPGTPKPVIHLKMTQRSADLFLGVPFNLASYALLLQMIASVLNMTPGRVVIDMGDVHIYENHFEQVETQLDREVRVAPTVDIDHLWLDLDGRVSEGDYRDIFKQVEPTAFKLVDYDPHEAIRAPMAA